LVHHIKNAVNDVKIPGLREECEVGFGIDATNWVNS